MNSTSAETTTTYVAHLWKTAGGATALLIEALGKRGDKSALPAIGAMAGEEDRAIHLAVVRALGQFDDPAFTSVVLEAALIRKGKSPTLGWLQSRKCPAAGSTRHCLKWLNPPTAAVASWPSIVSAAARPHRRLRCCSRSPVTVNLKRGRQRLSARSRFKRIGFTGRDRSIAEGKFGRR